MVKAFDFLVVTGPVDSKNAEYRRNVYSQSMRVFRRNERLQRIRAHEQSHSTIPEPSTKVQASTLVYQRATPSWGDTWETSQQAQEEPIAEPYMNLNTVGAYVGAELFDPFDSLPLPLSPDQQMLIAHFTWDIGKIPIPIPTSHPQELWSHVWLRRAMVSPLLFISICYHAAEHLDMIRGRESTRTALLLRGLTIRSLTETLYHTEGAVAADTVAALQLLIANCMISGNVEELTLHMAALDRVVLLRGGFGTLGIEGALQAVSRWHFAPCTMLTSLHNSRETPREDDTSNAAIADTETYYHKLEDLVHQSRALFSFSQISQPCEALTPATSQEFNEKRTMLDHQFIGLWKQLVDTRHCSSPKLETLKCGCLAGLLLTFCLLPGFGPRSAVTKKMTAAILLMAKDVKLSLIECSPTRYQQMWLWSLAVATVLSAKANQQTQLATLTRLVKDMLEITDFENLLARLHSLMWPPSIWDDSLREHVL